MALTVACDGRVGSQVPLFGSIKGSPLFNLTRLNARFEIRLAFIVGYGRQILDLFNLGLYFARLLCCSLLADLGGALHIVGLFGQILGWIFSKFVVSTIR